MAAKDGGNWNPLNAPIWKGVDWNPQHSDPGQALQKTGNAVVNLSRGKYGEAANDMRDSAGNWGRTAAGAGVLATPFLMPALTGGVGAGTMGHLANLFGSGAAIATARGMQQNELDRNSPEAAAAVAKEQADSEKQKSDFAQQQTVAQQQAAQRKAEQDAAQKANQGVFQSQNTLEDELRNAYQIRRRSNPNSY